jgi:hypothetical protein
MLFLITVTVTTPAIAETQKFWSNAEMLNTFLLSKYSRMLSLQTVSAPVLFNAINLTKFRLSKVH